MQAPQHKNLNPVVELVTVATAGVGSSIATTQKRGGAVFGAACEIIGVNLESGTADTITVTVFDANGVLVANEGTANDEGITLTAAAGTGPFTVTLASDSGTSTSTVHIYVRR